MWLTGAPALPICMQRPPAQHPGDATDRTAERQASRVETGTDVQVEEAPGLYCPRRSSKVGASVRSTSTRYRGAAPFLSAALDGHERPGDIGDVRADVVRRVREDDIGVADAGEDEGLSRRTLECARERTKGRRRCLHAPVLGLA